MVQLDLQFAVNGEGVPETAVLENWAAQCLDHLDEDSAALTLRIVGRDEIRGLNRDYRNIDKATNVLSFPFDPVAGIEERYLGDVVVCAAVVAEEAAVQDKPLQAHWAHMVIHGILHLCGYDHTTEKEAGQMEALEKRLLSGLGFTNPYNDE